MIHTREHQSVLAAAERRLLIAIARRLPPFVNSDHLTLIGLVSMPLAGFAFAYIPDARWIAAAAFVLALTANWFGDSLDGTLARVRNQQRPRYGFYVDHVIDLAGTAALVAGMAASGLMQPAIAAALVAAYFLVAAESYLATHAVGTFRISFAGCGPTELRVVLAIGALMVVNKPSVVLAGHHLRLLDVGASVGIAGLVVAFLTSAFKNTTALYRADPVPSRETAADAAHRAAAVNSTQLLGVKHAR